MTNEELLEQQKKAGDTSLAETTAKNTTNAAESQQNSLVNQAQAYLQSTKSNVPSGFSSPYSAQLESLYDKVMNRDKFAYDVSSDPLYQQYKNQYAQMGQLAMQDAIGDAASLTGGYSNSWAETAGNQAYQAYLQQLNNKVPELYEGAFNRYTQEGNDLQNQLAMTSDLYQNDYQRFMDQQQYQLQLQQYQLQAQQLAYQQAMQRQQNAYNQVMGMISAGMTPTDEMIAAAGLTKDALGLNKPAVTYTPKPTYQPESNPKPDPAGFQNPLAKYSTSLSTQATDKFGRPATTIITEDIGNGWLKQVDIDYDYNKPASTTVVKTNPNSPMMPTVVSTSQEKQNTQSATTTAKENALNSIIEEYERLLKSNSLK